MTNEGMDLRAVLAALKQRRVKLDTAIVALEEFITGETSGADSALVETITPGTIRNDTFVNQTALDAAMKYLAIIKRPQTPTEIAEALEAGGFTHSSKNFGNTIYTTLVRAEERGGDVIKVGRRWGLAEWYPGRRAKRRDTNGNAQTEDAPASPAAPDEPSEPGQPDEQPQNAA